MNPKLACSPEGTRTAGRVACCVLALSLGLGADLAAAQGDWLKRGKDLLGGIGGASEAGSALSGEEIGAGLKEALRVGAERVVAQVGRVDGFNADPSIHVPLPDSLSTVQSALERVGMSTLLDDLELRLNRAAEAAAPQAKEIFWQAIQDMTLDDVRSIYDGPSDAATRYFQGKMSDPLASAMKPVVETSLADVGAIQAYDRTMERYRAIPFVPDAKANLTDHVVRKGMDGIFHYLAREEAAIRADPAKRTTDLLRRVFGEH